VRVVTPAGDVLMQHWDPIGVADFPEAEDEYDRLCRPCVSFARIGRE